MKTIKFCCKNLKNESSGFLTFEGFRNETLSKLD